MSEADDQERGKVTLWAVFSPESPHDIEKTNQVSLMPPVVFNHAHTLLVFSLKLICIFYLPRERKRAINNDE